MAFSRENHVKNIIEKYSNFVPFDILLNDSQVNTIQAIWGMDKSEITDEQYSDFYRYIANAYDSPMLKLHFNTDAPIELRSIFFVGESHTGLY